MTVASPQNLKPRKTPRQARAEATVDAILEATIQVLLSGGAGRLTTTRVAPEAPRAVPSPETTDLQQGPLLLIRATRWRF
jgi:hypothetical protein